jgi:hypothetical protein
VRAIAFSFNGSHDFNINRTRRLQAIRANPPLVVDADAVTARAITFERFTGPADRGGSLQRCCVRTVEPNLRLSCETGKSLTYCSGKAFGFPGNSRSSLNLA